MADVMNSLFGMTPESIQRQRDNELQARALQFAKLDPQQAAQMAFYTAGSRLGDAGAGLLGYKDPELQRQEQRQGLMQGIDLTDANSLKQGIQAAMQNNDYALVSELTNRYQAANKSALDADVQRSIITKNTAERNAAATPADIQKAQRIAAIKAALPVYKEVGDTQTTTLLQNELDALAPADKMPSFGAEAERYSRQFYSKPYSELKPKEMEKVNAKVEETAKERANKTNINVSNTQETAFAKERGQLQAKTLAEAETQAKASANAVNRLANMEKLNQGPLISGPLAGSAIGAGQFLSSLGLLSPEAAKTLGSSEIYDKQAKDLVMQDLGGKLGAQISNADREFIEARIPQLRNSQPARTELIKKLKEIHNKNIDYYQRMSKEATKKGNLNDFDFASGAPDNTESAKPPVATKRYNPATRQLEAVSGGK
jgi:hypothetical protein